MAKQNANPPPWDDNMADGCSGVLDWLPLVGNMRPACVKHDKAYYFGGTKADKRKADQELKEDIKALSGLFAWLCAYLRFLAVRKFANSAFNWSGPGLPD